VKIGTNQSSIKPSELIKISVLKNTIMLVFPYDKQEHYSYIFPYCMKFHYRWAIIIEERKLLGYENIKELTTHI
jgi:hypothetical protein